MQRWVSVAALAAAGAGAVALVVFVVTQMRAPTLPAEPATAAAGLEEPRPTEEAKKHRIEVSGTEVVRWDEQGNVVWRAQASGKIELDEQQRTARAEEVNWVLEKGGLDRWTLQAPLMQADYDTARLLFSKGVRIEGERSQTAFSADRVVYEFDTEKLIGSGKVSLKRGKLTGSAGELVIDNRARKVRLKRGVRFMHTGVKIPG